MTVVSTLINIDFYKTTNGVCTGLESRRRHYLSTLEAAPHKQQPRKVKNVRGDRCAGFARRNRGWKRLPSLFCALNIAVINNKVVVQIAKTLQKSEVSLVLSLFLHLFFTLCPSLYFSLDFPSRWIVFAFGDPVPREIIAGRRILIAATYDLLRYIPFLFVLTRAEWRFKRC